MEANTLRSARRIPAAAPPNIITSLTNLRPSPVPPKSNKRKLDAIIVPFGAPAQQGKNKKQKTNKRQQPAKMAPGPASQASSSQDEPPIDYAAIRSWLTEQAHDPSRPITPLQKRALTDLTRSIKVDEPPLGNTDWISVLEKYRNAHRLEGPEHSFDDESATDGKWICICTFKGHKEGTVYKFPDRQAGAIPAFGKKKDAKRYAAKCCVEWLMSEKYMPSNGGVTFQPGAPGAAGARFFGPVTTDKPAPPPPDAQVGRSDGAPSPARRPSMELDAQVEGGARLEADKKDRSTIDVRDDDIPAPKRVEEMCRRLNLVTPRYDVTPNSTTDGHFDGYADFGVDTARIPTDVTRVSMIYSKRFTKEAIAEKLLKRLFEIEGQRQEELAELVDQVLAG
ncbi:hypothetical protein QBC43DRAFT_315654 [Cladorrhinum sp. PSN259]|nr:hypothetical protein QBC43DRAFT_315654 [Cladorrhinum sp. PSN259]